jgi:MFS transporter, LPLT family, lysophospholipid transporter
MNAKFRRNYPLLLASQFLSAFGVQAVLFVIIGQLTFQHNAGLITAKHLGIANALYASLLYLPYIGFAPLAGFLNDRFPKTNWLLGGNFISLIGVGIAALSLFGQPFWQGIGYFVVGLGACIFSPAKYGILPEILPTERLVKANGTIEMLTLVAILSGVMGGGAMIDKLPIASTSARVAACYGILAGVFALGTILIFFMEKTPFKSDVQLRASSREFFQHFKDLMTTGRFAKMILGTGIFWACGATLKMNFQAWGLSTLGMTDNIQISLLNLWLLVGIVIGSVLAGQLHRIGDLSWTQRYGWGLAALILLVGLIGRQTPHALIVSVLIAAGTCGGLFLIPLNAAIQAETDPTKLGKTIAVQNFINNIAMVSGGGLIYVATNLDSTPSGNFLMLAALVAAAVFWLRIPALKITKGAI